MASILQMVYMGADNTVEVLVQYLSTAGVPAPVDLSPVQRAVITIHGAAADGGDIVIDSATAPALVTWDAAGYLRAYLGTVVERVGDYTCTIVLYDPGHDDGQVITHPEAETALTFRVVQV